MHVGLEPRADIEETGCCRPRKPALRFYGTKTTIEIPDELAVAAKKRAAELRVPLRRLVIEGLRSRLAEDDEPRDGRVIQWVTAPGALAPDLDLSDRTAMHDWLARDRSEP
jgi:hypothetical protein